MGSLSITSPPLSIARQLWRLGEPDLALRAMNWSAEQAVDIAIRAGDRINPAKPVPSGAKAQAAPLPLRSARRNSGRRCLQ